ncbi:hypothetical protein ACFRAO_16070 [Streptomyces sp. NPDC056656]|uniref:hypothetical protein n=1 Tax=Streptomyces sp. NPDC056656 TaxID=3345895 RepID=UPI003694B75F
MPLHGEVRTECPLASFLDDRLGGKGSKKAANALRKRWNRGSSSSTTTSSSRSSPRRPTRADNAPGTPAFAVNGTLIREDWWNLMVDPKCVPLAVRTSTLPQ